MRTKCIELTWKPEGNAHTQAAAVCRLANEDLHSVSITPGRATARVLVAKERRGALTVFEQDDALLRTYAEALSRDLMFAAWQRKVGWYVVEVEPAHGATR